jgi:predicted RNA-binding protein with PUA-like domain
MGLVKVVKTHYLDPSDESGRFGMVDVAWHADFKTPVTLQHIKNHPHLQNMLLVKQSRLSVMPVDEESWKLILEQAQDKT